MRTGSALVDRPNHRLFGCIQMVTQRQGGIEVATADQGAENGHVLVYRDDVALFEIAFVPLIVEMEDHRNYLKRLIEKDIPGSENHRA